MKRYLLVAGVVAGVILLTGAVAYQAGVQHVVGDLQFYNNDPFGDYSTAIAESPTVLIDGSAGEVELGPGDSTDPDVVMSRVASDELGLDSGDEFTEGSVRTVAFKSGPLAADSVDQIAFIADREVLVTRIDAVWATAESAGTVGIMPERLQGTEAVGSGDDLLSSAFDGTGTANTVNNGSLTGTTANLTLDAGDRIGIDFTDDTPGELLNVAITITLRVTD